MIRIVFLLPIAYFVFYQHAKRLYPLKVSSKKALEWGYCATLEKEGDESSTSSWTVVDKSVLEASPLPEGLEKMIGFEGTPDPATGYYCVYAEGLQTSRERSTASKVEGVSAPRPVKNEALKTPKTP
jgi:hypothetical protein